MFAFIELTPFGGSVSIAHSQFLNFRKCGSLIGNPSHSLASLLSQNQPILSELKALATASSFPYSFSCPPDLYAVSPLNLCYQVSSFNSSYSQIGFPSQTRLHKAPRDPGTSVVPRFLGSVINLVEVPLGGKLHLESNIIE